VHFIRNLFLSRKQSVVASELEKKTDEVMKSADLDLDKKLNQKEFQMYLSKNRDALKILDNYASLLNNNPMSASKAKVTSGFGGGERDDEKDNEGGENQDDGDYFVSGKKDLDGDFDNDPDLLNELHRKDMGEEEEEKLKVKQGIEFKTVKVAGAFNIEEEAAGDQFGACKPWMGAILHTVPSDYNPSKKDTDVSYYYFYCLGSKCKFRTSMDSRV